MPSDVKAAVIIPPISMLIPQNSAAVAAKLRKLQNQISRTEAEIEQAEERLAQIDGEFAKPEVATNSARLSELHAERTEIQEKLDGLYELWESLSE